MDTSMVLLATVYVTLLVAAREGYAAWGTVMVQKKTEVGHR